VEKRYTAKRKGKRGKMKKAAKLVTMMIVMYALVMMSMQVALAAHDHGPSGAVVDGKCGMYSVQNADANPIEDASGIYNHFHFQGVQVNTTCEVMLECSREVGEGENNVIIYGEEFTATLPVEDTKVSRLFDDDQTLKCDAAAKACYQDTHSEILFCVSNESGHHH